MMTRTVFVLVLVLVLASGCMGYATRKWVGKNPALVCRTMYPDPTDKKACLDKGPQWDRVTADPEQTYEYVRAHSLDAPPIDTNLCDDHSRSYGPTDMFVCRRRTGDCYHVMTWVAREPKFAAPLEWAPYSVTEHCQ